jgi:hypothetical protein
MYMYARRSERLVEGEQRKREAVEGKQWVHTWVMIPSTSIAVSCSETVAIKEIKDTQKACILDFCSAAGERNGMLAKKEIELKT